MSLASRLREKRYSLQLTQEKASELMTVPRSTYSFWERGTYRPKNSVDRKKAQDFLEVTDQEMEDILLEEDHPTASDIKRTRAKRSVAKITDPCEFGVENDAPIISEEGTPKYPVWKRLNTADTVQVHETENRDRLTVIREEMVLCRKQIAMIDRYISLLEEESKILGENHEKK